MLDVPHPDTGDRDCRVVFPNYLKETSTAPNEKAPRA